MLDLITKLHNSGHSVFSFKDIVILSGVQEADLLAKRIYYYCKQGQLIQLRRGLYALNEKYDKKELACKIYKPSYISTFTVLTQAGVVFQYHPEINLISYLRREITIDEQVYKLYKINSDISTNPQGIIHKNNYAIASTERALLDTIYLIPNAYFDNLDPIDWENCFELSEIYQNKSLVKRLNQYYKHHKENL
jgi:hypothetical protein